MPAETSGASLLDRLGTAVRQDGGTADLSIDPTGPPAFTEQDIFTLYAMSSLNDPSFLGQYPAVIDQINQQLSQFPDSASSATTAQGEIVTAATIGDDTDHRRGGG